MCRRLICCLLLSLFVLPSGTASAQTPSRRVGDSDDPTEASVLMSQDMYPEGGAGYVVIGRNDVFADNLAGAPLAALTRVTGSGGPLLLVPPVGGLPATVRDEVARVHPETNVAACDDSDPPDRVHDVYILGGAAAVDLQVETQLVEDGYCVKRLSGPSRVETSIAVALELRRLHRIDNTASNSFVLYVARTDNAADSAAGGALAALYDQPVVVTQTESLHPAVQALLTESTSTEAPAGNVQAAILLGGTAALSTQVEQQIVDATANHPDEVAVLRFAGATRDDTAVVIANENISQRLAAATIVNGFTEDFWTYALPGAVVSAFELAPMLFVQRDFVPETTESYLNSRDANNYLVTIGPESQITAETQAAAEAAIG